MPYAGPEREARGSDAIGPTAHYTAYVWARNGLSHPALDTDIGRLLYMATLPTMTASRLLGGPTIEDFLLTRHRLMDHLLETAISDGRVSQVLEIACGLSPRGWRFAERHGDRIDYVEADLPPMAARKREALERAGSLGPHHRVVDIDALTATGPLSLAAVAGELDPRRGLAIVTEGLIHYLDTGALAGLWDRIAGTLTGFPHGTYTADTFLAEQRTGPLAAAFRLLLSGFVRGRVHDHYRNEAEADRMLADAGFSQRALHDPHEFAGRIELSGHGAGLVRVIEASP